MAYQAELKKIVDKTSDTTSVQVAKQLSRNDKIDQIYKMMPVLLNAIKKSKPVYIPADKKFVSDKTYNGEGIYIPTKQICSDGRAYTPSHIRIISLLTPEGKQCRINWMRINDYEPNYRDKEHKLTNNGHYNSSSVVYYNVDSEYYVLTYELFGWTPYVSS